MNRERDELGNRMKEYEAVPNIKLTRRTPVILRLDMCHGHSFTRGFSKPFDSLFVSCMQQTMLYLCENIQNVVFGYTQSDEISLVMVDYKRLNTAAWFDDKVEKICSVAASMGTLAFNKAMLDYMTGWQENNQKNLVYFDAFKRGAIFDCRCFNLPKEEVTNYFYWRQKDAIRNSIEATAQSFFSQRELEGKNQIALIKMLKKEKGIDWITEIPIWEQRGSGCIKGEIGWGVEHNIPIFKDEDREYIEKLIYIGE